MLGPSERALPTTALDCPRLPLPPQPYLRSAGAENMRWPCGWRTPGAFLSPARAMTLICTPAAAVRPRPGESFGELEILRSSSRKYTVVAIHPTSLMVLDLPEYQEILRRTQLHVMQTENEWIHSR